MRFIELHEVVWGPISPSMPESCVRLSDTLFEVHVNLTRTDADNYWITGLGAPAPPHALHDDPLVLSGVTGKVIALVAHDPPHEQFSGVTVRAELSEPLPRVVFIPDPALASPNGPTYERALEIGALDGTVIVNWIWEDADAWYFNFWSFGKGTNRVSKLDGALTEIETTMPMPTRAR